MSQVCWKSSRAIASALLAAGLVAGSIGCRAAAPRMVDNDAFKCGEHHGSRMATGVHGPNSIVYRPGGRATTLDGRPVDSRGQVIQASHEGE